MQLSFRSFVLCKCAQFSFERFQISTISGSCLRCLRLCYQTQQDFIASCDFDSRGIPAIQKENRCIRTQQGLSVRSERMNMQSFFIFPVKLSVNKDLSKDQSFVGALFYIQIYRKRVIRNDNNSNHLHP